MKTIKKKIYRKYQDFYSPKDLVDPDKMPTINLTISDFNAKGYLENPRAPCVATTIDPGYIKDARTQKLTKKFRMKTDILQLREITRRKFMIYATQEMHLEMQRDAEFQEYVFRRLVNFLDFASDSLNKIEAQSFKELKEAQGELEKLKEVKLADELKDLVARHQSILGEVRELYGRFLYLLKLIGYFDEIVIDDVLDANSSNPTKLLKPPEITELEITDKMSGKVGIELIKEYMEKIVRPYLAQRHHMNAEIWIKGYEQTRNKIFNYNRRFANLALLNHITGIFYEKFQKTYARSIVKPIFLKDPEFMRRRAEALRESAHKVMNEIEMKYKTDKVYLTLNALVKVILQSFEPKPKEAESRKPSQSIKKKFVKPNKVKPTPQAKKEDESNVLDRVEKIQVKVLDLLNKLDALPIDIVKKAERTVRRRKNLEQEISRRALIKQNRMHNWREHMKRHELERAKQW